MKRVIIVHGWDHNPSSDWFPWLKGELESRGFEVLVPEMPETSFPKPELWVPELERVVGAVDENTIFVGHSIGCQTILRYLVKTEKRVGGVVLVTPWIALQNLETQLEKDLAELWLGDPVDLEKARMYCGKLVAIFSDNDQWVPLEENKNAFEKIGASVYIEQNKGHYSEDDGITEAPTVLDKVLEITK